MRFSLVHPSRGRPDLAKAAGREWRSASSGVSEIEHLLSVDDDDPALSAYRVTTESLGATLVSGPNRSLVEAANRAAAQATGDILIVVSDDFGCPKDWDASLALHFKSRRDIAVLVNDGLGARVLTLPIVGRELYLRLGYVYHPSYHGMFVDDDLTETARAMNALVDARSLLFPHRHFTIGESSLDATYLRHNQPSSWWTGWRTFQKRRLAGFGVIAPDPEVNAASARVDTYVRLRVAGSIVRRLWSAHLPVRLVSSEQRLRNWVLRTLERWLKLSAPI